VLPADHGRDLAGLKPLSDVAKVAREGRRRFGRVVEKRLDSGVLGGTEIPKVERRRLARGVGVNDGASKLGRELFSPDRKSWHPTSTAPIKG
jgi:hypothetical protein